MSQQYEINRHNGAHGGVADREPHGNGYDGGDGLLNRVKQLVDATITTPSREDEEIRLLQRLAERVADLAAVASEAREWIRSELEWIGGADAPEGSPLHEDHAFLAKLDRVLEGKTPTHNA